MTHCEVSDVVCDCNAGVGNGCGNLREFFASRPEEAGSEPDWEAHLQVVAESRRRGLAAT
ncbi:hypothetical protein BST45_02915 [Mycobacterium shinjukuense]|nr:hypothetical protein BST45_02915 [Mycobacterium shinjukuense]